MRHIECKVTNYKNETEGGKKIGNKAKSNPLDDELNKGYKKTASYLHRTATTIYPCCVPTLGDSIGAGRVGLAEPQIYDEAYSNSKESDITNSSNYLKYGFDLVLVVRTGFEPLS